jgi:hypothetical protein
MRIVSPKAVYGLASSCFSPPLAPNFDVVVANDITIVAIDIRVTENDSKPESPDGNGSRSKATLIYLRRGTKLGSDDVWR